MHTLRYFKSFFPCCIRSISYRLRFYMDALTYFSTYTWARAGKGGKCIAVTFGSLMALIPKNYIVLLLALIFIIFSCVIIITPCSTRVILTMITFIITSWFFTPELYVQLSALLIGILIIYKHLKAPDPGPFHIQLLLHHVSPEEFISSHHVEE